MGSMGYSFSKYPVGLSFETEPENVGINRFQPSQKAVRAVKYQDLVIATEHQ